MEFYDILDQIVALLQRRGRVTYNALKLQFSLDDDQLAVLKDELLYAHPQVVDDAGRGLHWTGDAAATQAPVPPTPRPTPQSISQAGYPPQDAALSAPVDLSPYHVLHTPLGSLCDRGNHHRGATQS